MSKAEVNLVVLGVTLNSEVVGGIGSGFGCERSWPATSNGPSDNISAQRPTATGQWAPHHDCSKKMMSRQDQTVMHG